MSKRALTTKQQFTKRWLQDLRSGIERVVEEHPVLGLLPEGEKCVAATIAATHFFLTVKSSTIAAIIAAGQEDYEAVDATVTGGDP